MHDGHDEDLQDDDDLHADDEDDDDGWMEEASEWQPADTPAAHARNLNQNIFPIMMRMVMVMMMMTIQLVMMMMIVMVMIVTLHSPLLLCFLAAPHSLLPDHSTILNVHPQNRSQSLTTLNWPQKSRHNSSQSGSSAGGHLSPTATGHCATPSGRRARARHKRAAAAQFSIYHREAARVSLVWSPPLFWSGLVSFGDLQTQVSFEHARLHSKLCELHGDPPRCQALPQTKWS